MINNRFNVVYHFVMCSLLTKSKYMIIRLIEEYEDREVELIGKVLCTRSDEYNMLWEFR